MQAELTAVLENTSLLEQSLSDTSALLQASEERETDLAVRVEAVEAQLQAAQGGSGKVEQRCAELAVEVQTLQRSHDVAAAEAAQLRDEAGVARALEAQKEAAEKRHSTVSEEMRIVALQLEVCFFGLIFFCLYCYSIFIVLCAFFFLQERQMRVEEWETKHANLERSYTSLTFHVQDYFGNDRSGDDLLNLLKEAGKSQRRLQKELYGKEAELQKRV